MRVERAYYASGVVGISHTIRTPVFERPRKFKIDVGFVTAFNGSVNKEYYFNPQESVGVGTSAGIGTDGRTGVGTMITFENPGNGPSQLFLPARSIYLPNHKLRTGDEVIYNRKGNTSIGISTNKANASFVAPSTNLPESVPLWVAKLTDDTIGLSTVRIGLSTAYDANAAADGLQPWDTFVGIGTTNRGQGLVYFTSSGSGFNHSLKINYPNVVTGSTEKNKVNVSVSDTHGLAHNDLVELVVDAGITTTVPVKYNNCLLYTSPSPRD